MIFLKISGKQRAAFETKSRISLVTHVMKYLEREEITDLEDEGMSVLLLLKYKITDLTTSADSGVGQISILWEKQACREKWNNIKK